MLKDKTVSKSKVPAHKLGKYQTRQQNYRSIINSIKQFLKMPFCIASVEMFMIKHSKYKYGCQCWKNRQQLSAVEPYT